MVERAAAPPIPRLRRRLLEAARALTTPQLPDDYLGLLRPSWSTREATGIVVGVRPETAEAATVRLRPAHAWPGHAPGQYLRIGVEIAGVRHWRAYSITSDPGAAEVTVTVKRVEGGRVSSWLLSEAGEGTVVFLGAVEGTFGLPDPPPAKLLALTAGSGVTPVAPMLRDLDRRGALTDAVHLHAVRTPAQFIFGEQLRELAARRPGYLLHERLTANHGRPAPAELDRLVPDWRERTILLSGPRAMIDAFEAHVGAHGGPGTVLLVERFQPVVGDGSAPVGEGGSVVFRRQRVEAHCTAGVSLLVGGEQAGARLAHGCRMGICHTCVGRLQAGRVRDLRTGEVHGEPGQTIRTCVNAPEGAVELDL